MRSAVHEISEHMLHLGKYLLGHGLEHTVFTNGHPYWSSMGVLHIAQSAETLIKAAIAKEHPSVNIHWRNVVVHTPASSD